jgi:hypothetical protein
MSLFKEWQERLENQGTNENQEFFENYLEKEKQAYKTILSSGTTSLTGKVYELAQKYDMDSNIIDEMADLLIDISQKRNDINHAGYRNNRVRASSADKFANELGRFADRFENIIYVVLPKKTLLCSSAFYNSFVAGFTIFFFRIVLKWLRYQCKYRQHQTMYK